MTFDKKYFEENEPRFLAELFSLIRIPSISAKPSHKADMTRCAERWCELLVEAGADHARLMPSAGNPLVYAERHVSDDARTVLIYAHYDVMPAEPLELWKSNPFEPEVRDGHIFARGADDDKGQAFIQVKAFEYLVRNNLLKHNVKFIFEGEEEIGSPSLAAFLEEHKELLKCDVILVSDTSMLGADLPSLTTGLRGLAYWQIEVTGANRDLHSGHFGGAVANPINVLCKLIADVIDENGRITIPHFYDDVEEVPAAEREMIAAIPFDEEAYKQGLGVEACKAKKATARWNAIPAALRSMSAASGADTPTKGRRPSSRRKPMPRSPRALCHTSSTKRFRSFSSTILRTWHREVSKWKSHRSTAVRATSALSPSPPIAQQKMVSRKPSANAHWQCVAAAASPSSAISSACSA